MRAKAKHIQPWGIKAKQALAARNMSIEQLAKEIGLSRPYVTHVINGGYLADDAKRKICDYLGISSV